jgi:hypothetical protein
MLDSEFIPKEIKNDIVKNFQECVKKPLSFKSNNSSCLEYKMNLSVHSAHEMPDRDKMDDREQVNKIFQKFMLYLEKKIPENYLYFLLDKKISIHYYPTSYKKKTPTKSTRLSYCHVNSAYTIKKRNGNGEYEYIVVIFRKEEIERTVIHELFHALEVHCAFSGGTIVSVPKEMGSHLSHGLLCNNLRIAPKNIVFDESLVETWSTIIYCALLKKNIANEKEFSNFQSAKLIRHFGFKNVFDFFKSRKIQTDTNAFCYYILKSAFLMNIQMFKSTFPLASIHNCGTIKSSDLSYFLEDVKWVQAVELIIKNYNKYPAKWKKSMRMTYPYHSTL